MTIRGKYPTDRTTIMELAIMTIREIFDAQKGRSVSYAPLFSYLPS